MSGATSIPTPAALGLVPLSVSGGPQTGLDSWSVRMADMCLNRFPILSSVWDYGWGVVLKGVEQVWLNTGGPKYQEYIERNVGQFVEPDGNIRTYCLQDYNLDQINTGKLFFGLYQTTGDERYRQALHLLMRPVYYPHLF